LEDPRFQQAVDKYMEKKKKKYVVLIIVVRVDNNCS